GIQLIQDCFAQVFSTTRSLPPTECFPSDASFLQGRSSVPRLLVAFHHVGDKSEKTIPFPENSLPRYIRCSVSQCRTRSQVQGLYLCPVLWWRRMAQIYASVFQRPCHFLCRLPLTSQSP